MGHIPDKWTYINDIAQPKLMEVSLISVLPTGVVVPPLSNGNCLKEIVNLIHKIAFNTSVLYIRLCTD